MKWQPIQDLPDNWQELVRSDLQALADEWTEQRRQLSKTPAYKSFLQRMRREIAIETGIIERLYTLDRGTTVLLIERGIDESLIAHNTTNQSPREIVALIRDHDAALERVFDFVGERRELSTSYIKQLHQLLTKHQDTTEAIDQFGKAFEAELLKGEWKQYPNNPTRPDGTVHEYCPPEQVASQMDDLLRMYAAHHELNVSPEVEAAWFHHRFAQIHPFQDGNGRVARLLASLIFIKADWFPLTIRNNDRDTYIKALEAADNGNLEPLVALFAKSQREAFAKNSDISENFISSDAGVQTVLNAIGEKLQQKQEAILQGKRKQVQAHAHALQQVVHQRLESLRDELNQLLKDQKGAFVVRVNAADFEAPHDYYFYAQIVEIAKLLGYFANVREYKAWVRISIRLEHTQTDMVFAFHAIGRDVAVMGCLPFIFRKSQSPDDDSPEADVPAYQDLQGLAELPFQFTYQQDMTQLQADFAKWIEPVLTAGLSYWYETL